jgi:membrane fusion protein (multidrug efflux system)
MKIKMTKKRLAILVLLIIVVPIIYNKLSGVVTGIMMQKAMSMPKEVVVDHPYNKDANISAESTGRVEAQYSVDVIARVSGWLQKKYFNEGDFVHKGQLLFQIDPKEYQLEVNNSRAAVNQYSALLKNAQQELDRANSLIKEDLISHSDVDSSLATRNSNRALLDAARQKYELALVNLGYTRIISPIEGRIGKIKITEGNYVTATSGPLVNISSLDPVYVSFSLRSSDFVKLLKASDKFKDVQVKVQFSTGEWYSEIGQINFVDNQIDQNSGSVPMRATFKNPKGILVPGDYMKVELVAPKQIAFLMVPQSCTKGDAMSGYYVWVVKDNKAVRRDIKVSDAVDNNWIVTEGLSADDTIVVAGIQDIATEGQSLKIITSEEYNKKEKAGKK